MRPVACNLSVRTESSLVTTPGRAPFWRIRFPPQKRAKGMIGRYRKKVSKGTTAFSKYLCNGVSCCNQTSLM